MTNKNKRKARERKKVGLRTSELLLVELEKCENQRNKFKVRIVTSRIQAVVLRWSHPTGSNHLPKSRNQCNSLGIS